MDEGARAETLVACHLLKAVQGRTESPALAYFQGQTGAPHAFQVVLALPFQGVDCFTAHHPVVVPALTLLSQLL